MDELATLRFVHQGQHVLILGPTGVGKTQLATGLSLKATWTATGPTSSPCTTSTRPGPPGRNRLHILHTTLLRADLFILDEVGFQPLERGDATFLFEAINKRYAAHKSTILTSNKSYGQWHEIFPDPVLAVALLDRLLHHTTINIRGDSYRLRHRKQAGLPTTEEMTMSQNRRKCKARTGESVHDQTGVDSMVCVDNSKHSPFYQAIGHSRRTVKIDQVLVTRYRPGKGSERLHNHRGHYSQVAAQPTQGAQCRSALSTCAASGRVHPRPGRSGSITLSRHLSPRRWVARASPTGGSRTAS